jgi:CvfB-like winged helix domain
MVLRPWRHEVTVFRRLLQLAMILSTVQRGAAFVFATRHRVVALQTRPTGPSSFRRCMGTVRASPQNGPPFVRRKSPDRNTDALRMARLLEEDPWNDRSAERDRKFDLTEGIPEQQIEFRVGLPIMVEVVSFGPLGASVAIIAKSHNPEEAVKSSAENPLATGIIYQTEIQFFREMRRNVDVVLGEVLPAYVERVRDDGKIDVALRVIGGRAKVDQWSDTILGRLGELGELNVGNKSSPQEIAREFPGMSKTDFKKCIGALFEQRKVFPFPYAVYKYQEGMALKDAENNLRRINPQEEQGPKRTNEQQ